MRAFPSPYKQAAIKVSSQVSIDPWTNVKTRLRILGRFPGPVLEVNHILKVNNPFVKYNIRYTPLFIESKFSFFLFFFCFALLK